jgi:ABC-2 type transport system ATP-binding protein
LGSGDAVIAEGLAKQYPGGVWGAKSVSFSSNYGELIVILGPNGAGKTTTINMLTTLIKPSGGRGLVGGYDIVSERDKVRRIVALMPQDASMSSDWTPYEAVKWYLVARGFSISDAGREARVWLEEMDLYDARNRLGWWLSGGQRKRVLAAMVLATRAPVIFLDEPTSGVDVEGKYKVWSAIRRACRDARAVIYTTHDMREAELVADRVVMIGEGRTIVIGKPKDLVDGLPFKYKIVLRGKANHPEGLVAEISVGDITITYYRDRSDAIRALDSIETSASIEPVSLEDAYLYYVKMRGGSRWA